MTDKTAESMIARLHDLEKHKHSNVSANAKKAALPLAVALSFIAGFAVNAVSANHDLSKGQMDWLVLEIAEKHGILPNAARELIRHKTGL